MTFDRHVWASDIKKTGMQSLELIASGEDEAPEVFNDKSMLIAYHTSKDARLTLNG